MIPVTNTRLPKKSREQNKKMGKVRTLGTPTWRSQRKKKAFTGRVGGSDG